jgi:REP element-mobilizing transposase RayT
MVLLQHWTTHICSAAKSALHFLFVIFINQLPYIVENRTETTLHADDTKLHKTITLALPYHAFTIAPRGRKSWLMSTVKKFFVTYFQETCEITVNYTIEVWPCANNIQLSIRVERLPRQATRWIMVSRRALTYNSGCLPKKVAPVDIWQRKLKPACWNTLRTIFLASSVDY